MVFELDNLTDTATVDLGESIPANEQLLSVECSRDGTDITSGLAIDLGAGTVIGIQLTSQEIVSCTFINGPAPAQDRFLTVRKAVDNAAGGTATDGDFDLFIGERPVSRGQRV